MYKVTTALHKTTLVTLLTCLFELDCWKKMHLINIMSSNLIKPAMSVKNLEGKTD